MSSVIDWPEGLVAFWDFAEDGPPYTTAAGADAFPLRDGSGSRVSTSSAGPFGHAAVFDGIADHLVIPSADVGELDLARTGSGTVLAWVRRGPVTHSGFFIAGRWNEDNAGPSRQYGLFGQGRAIGHVSRSGSPEADYPYARSASVSARGFAPGDWRLIGFTYDGLRITSYLDGIADRRPRYTDYEGWTYSLNPYEYPDGLLPGSVSDFTVGANRIGDKLGPSYHRDGIGLFYRGEIGGLAVFDHALSATEIFGIHRATLLAGDPVHRFEFFQGDGWPSEVAPASAVGWRSVRGSTATETTSDLESCNFLAIGSPYCGPGSPAVGFLFRSADGAPANRREPAIAYVEGLEGLRTSEAIEIRFLLGNRLAVDELRVCIRVGSAWFASEETYAVSSDGRRGHDWSAAEARSIRISREPRRWRALAFDPGTELVLGGALDASLPDGQITALGFYNGALRSEHSVVRIADVRVHEASSSRVGDRSPSPRGKEHDDDDR